MANRFHSALLLITLLYASLSAQEPEIPAHRVGVIFGGNFEGFEVTGPLEGAKKTVMAAHYEWEYGVRPFTKKVWEERKLEWDAFFKTARSVADATAAKLEPQLIRDARGVVLYAIIADKDPFLTSVILSPSLHERFRESLGDRILAILLERHRIYLFPATGGTLEEFGPSIVAEYQQSSFPISLEVFLIDKDGFRIVGEIERETTSVDFGDPAP